MSIVTMALWMEDALCATRPINPDAFHASKETRRQEVQDALELCAICPVRQQCLDDALANHDRYGIWGGLSEEQRRPLHDALDGRS